MTEVDEPSEKCKMLVQNLNVFFKYLALLVGYWFHKYFQNTLVLGFAMYAVEHILIVYRLFVSFCVSVHSHPTGLVCPPASKMVSEA